MFSLKMQKKASKEYVGVSNISGPIIIIEGPKEVGFGEIVSVLGSDGKERRGRVLETGERYVTVQVFEGTTGLSIDDTRVRFRGESAQIPVSPDMLGRIFSGIGEPLDGGPPPASHTKRDINGLPINPTSRTYPRNFIGTGISVIDGLNTLIRGQKLPIFSGSGLPHNQIAAQIIKQAKLKEEGQQNFAIIFTGMGIKNDEAEFFQDSFREAGTSDITTMFLNLASAPAQERMITPRYALTLAEYLAFEEEMHVLVILTDMTNYCEALREVAGALEEVPSRKGYPGYMYTDLATIYERSGRIKGKEGSITQIPILSMPNMDITHPIPDLTGYITEGQIVLSQELHKKNIYPPVEVLPSLSRLMKDGIGKGLTREDHSNLASQLYSSYAESKRIRALASIIGEEELTEADKSGLEFGDKFERDFINQGLDEDRSISKTLDIGWKILSVLPKEKLTRVNQKQIDKYL